MRNRQLGAVIIIVLILSACTASESQIATAIAKTEQASPSDTPAPTSTALPTLTDTPIPSPTFTLTPTPDVRVIDANPNLLILERTDLPPEGKFHLVYSTPHRNYEIISVRGQANGTKYLEVTGRVDGWILEYDRGTLAARVPEYVGLYPVLYKTDAGAEYVMHEDGDLCSSPDGKTTKLEELAIGDESLLCLWKEMQSSGKYYYMCDVYMRYRNVFFSVYGGGFEDTFDKEWVIDIAQRQLEKLESHPLSDVVLFTP